jgi:hypothetical protein
MTTARERGQHSSLRDASSHILQTARPARLGRRLVRSRSDSLPDPGATRFQCTILALFAAETIGLASWQSLTPRQPPHGCIYDSMCGMAAVLAPRR